MKNKLLLILSLIGFSNLLQAQSIERSVINTTGGLLAPVGGPQLMVNMGETFIATYSNSDAMLTEGFLQPQAILYIPAIAGNTSLCIGSISQLTDSIPGGIWSSLNNNVATVSATGLVTAYTVGTASIVYTIGEVSVSVTITVHGFPTAMASTTQPIICPNGNTTITANGGVSYLWSNGDTATTTTVNQAGGYYVVATNEFGCTDTSNLLTITQKTLPTTVKIKYLNGMTACQPNTVNYALDMPLGSTTGFAYQWYYSGAPIAGATDSVYSAAASGVYNVSVSGGSNCVKLSSAKAATVFAQPTASFSVSGSPLLCAGGFVTMVAPTMSGYTYTWLKDGVSVGTGNSKIFKVAGNYTVVAKQNGCTDTASPAVAVVVNPLPIASVAALTPATFCAGDSCTINASPANAVNYEWHNGNVTTATTITPNYTVGVAGTFKVMVTDMNGCVSKISSTNVKTKINIKPIAVINYTGSTTISSTGSLKLKANITSAATWQWYKDGNPIANATASTYTATSGGSYTVAITKLGCTGISAPVVITQTTPKETTATSSFTEGSFEIRAYPNPVSDVLTVTIIGMEAVDGTIQVINALGQIVVSYQLPVVRGSQPTTDHSQLNTTNWASGVYFIRYKDAAGRTGTLKVVKE